MLGFIARRILLMIPTLFVVSIISFIIIEAPPGDFMDAYVDQLIQQQEAVDPVQIPSLRALWIGPADIHALFSLAGQYLAGRFGTIFGMEPASDEVARRSPPVDPGHLGPLLALCLCSCHSNPSLLSNQSILNR